MPLEIIVGTDESLPFSFLRDGEAAGASVVRIERADRAKATGFIFAPGFLMTNNHVLPDAATAATAIAVAGAERGTPLGTSRTAFDPAAGFWTDVDLDFAVCALAPGSTIPPLPKGSAPDGAVQDELNAIGHPGGGPKMVSIREGQVDSLTASKVRYRTDTRPGSSGSPIFDDAWRLIAVHHSSMIDDAGHDNEGILVVAIARRLVELGAPAALVAALACPEGVPGPRGA